MNKMLVSIFICLIFSIAACDDAAHNWHLDAETKWSDDKNDEILPHVPRPAPPKKIALPQKFINALIASRKTWDNLKKESNNTYSYQLESGIPGWTPNRYQTTIEIEEGVFVDYTIKPIQGSINEEMKRHFPPRKTLDELYDECEHKIIPNLTNDQWFNLDFFTNGVLASCSYDTCGLADNEGAGINLNALALQRTKYFASQYSVRSDALTLDCK